VRLGPRLSMDLTGSVLRLDVHGIRKQFPRGLLDVLAFYQEPHTLEEGLQFLGRSARGMQSLAVAFTRLIELCEQGVLVPHEGNPPAPPGRRPQAKTMALPRKSAFWRTESAPRASATPSYPSGEDHGGEPVGRLDQAA
jgi:hypothetical protein